MYRRGGVARHHVRMVEVQHDVSPVLWDFAEDARQFG